MPAFFLAFLSVFLATIAGRDAIRVARLAGAGVPASGLLLAAGFAALATAAFAATLGDQLAPVLNERGRMLITAIALGVTGGEVLLMRARNAPQEPTLSVGAAALVLGASLLTGASGLLVMAITLALGEPLLAGAGGALGALAALAPPALAASDWEAHVPQAALRRVIGGLLAAAAIAIGISAFIPIF